MLLTGKSTHSFTLGWQTKEKKYLLAACLESFESNPIMITKYQIKSTRYFLSACERHAQTKEKKYSLAACLELFESNLEMITK